MGRNARDAPKGSAVPGGVCAFSGLHGPCMGANWKDPDAAKLDRIGIEEKRRIEELEAKK